MAMHAKSGGNLEVMGMMQGKVQGGTFIVLDAFALPVEGTETRVNAQEEAYEFMVAYNHASKVCGTTIPLCMYTQNPTLYITVHTHTHSKSTDLKTWWGGITVTLAMGVGCLALTALRKWHSKCFKTHSLRWWSTPIVPLQLAKWR